MKHRGFARWAAIVVVACAGNPAAAGAQHPASGVPADTSAAGRAREFAALLARGDRSGFAAYIESSFSPALRARVPLEERLGRLAAAHEVTRGMTRLSVRPASALRAEAVFWSPVLEDWMGYAVEVEEAPPHRITRATLPNVTQSPAGAAAPRRANSDREAWRGLDAFSRRLAAAHQFSGVVLVARGGQAIGSGGYGDASKEFGVKNTPSTRVILGSINKMFTAVAILQLVERGRLSLDDPVGQHLPGVLPAEVGQVVRIKHLLTHTSGLGDFLFSPEMIAQNRAQYRTVADYLPLLRKDSLAFTPGTRWAYSNTGFLVLGAVLERVTGRPYDEYVADMVFRPAGMSATGGVELDRVPTGVASGYTRDYSRAGLAWRSDRYDQVVTGTPAGGGYSTAADLMRFVDALRSAKLLSAATTAAMLTPKPELSSPAYGFGVEVFDGAARLVGHTGGGPGTAAHVQFDRHTGFAVVALGNMDGRTEAVVRRAFATFPVTPPR